ncbi:MAG: hypothetical protein MJB57_07095 [Gemmatimonadetes bacterium]|nr:hypothetical protein [Gemmatimonadota bacterium]
MNEIGLFFGRPAGLDASGAPRLGGDAEEAFVEGEAGAGSGDFEALLGGLLSRPTIDDAAALFRELGVDPRLEGVLREAGLGSDALKLIRELGLDETGVAALEGPTEVGAVNRSLDEVSRELKRRVEIVQDRMLSEFGHTVRVVETHRSQERQAELYAQGRTKPGPIVTWTEHSAHTEGLAVDVIVDGGYDDDLAYERLQRIAREEGLKTLGPSDRGHLELDRSAVEHSTTTHGYGVARIARVARVASPARVATPGNAAPPTPEPLPEVPRVDTPGRPTAAGRPPTIEVAPPEGLRAASPARVAMPENATRATSEPLPEVPRVDPPGRPTAVDRPPALEVAPADRANARLDTEPGPGTRRRDGAGETGPRVAGEPIPAKGESGAVLRSSVGTSGGREGDDGQEADRDGVRSIADAPGRGVGSDRTPSGADGARRTEPTLEPTASALGRATSTTEPTPTRPEALEGTARADGVERVTQIRDLQLDGRTHRVSRLVIDIPDGAESIGKVDLSARGELISARIDAVQPSLAARLRTHVVELHQDLVARGLQPETLHVRDARLVDAVRLVAGSAGSTNGVVDLAASGSEAGRGSTAGSGSNRDGQTDLDRNDTNDARSRDRDSAPGEDGRRDRK